MPSPTSRPPEELALRPIGYVRTAYSDPADTPIQTTRNPGEPGRLVVLDQYAAALEGLDGFDYAHLVCFLDRAWEADRRGTRPFTGDRLRPVPFLLQDTGERVGVFATRAPVRPNYLALSLVRVLGVEGTTVEFAGVDLLDGTPVLDIKPFEPHLDVPGYRPGTAWLDQIRGGWYQRHDAAANPLVRPGRRGLEAAGLDPAGGPSRTASGIREVAERANLPEGFVRRLVEAGALPGEEAGLGVREVRRARLLHSWTAAGLSVEVILELVDRGALSLAFLDAPVMATPERLDRSYQQLAADRGVDPGFVQAVHQALGFAPPEPGNRAGEDDLTMLEVAELFRGAGVEDEATLRLLGVYADSLRRIAKAEADHYEAHIERRLRRTGLGERELIELGTRFGDRIIGLLERALLLVYRRHREHIWTEHAINHVEEALEGSGLQERVPRPPAICFVDLTGYTQLTEERGDEAAAEVAGRLAALVGDLSRSRGGRPVRWLGDGGMFHFREPSPAVLAGLDMVERAPAAGLPSAHVGIHTGPVIFQDGDVYGRTVNVAARISSYARAGQVVVSEETVHRCGGDALRFEALGAVDLKGVGRPLPLYRAFRS